jgi:3-oxoacyl-[acyl-carrier protein] reductase
MFSLEGKNALVTGATGGIGSAIATSLYHQGANVLITGTKTEKLKSLASDLGERAQYVCCDLSEAAQIGDLINKANEMLGSVDILVCNAGITRDTLAMRMSNEMFDEVININLRSIFMLNRDVLRGMMRSRWGRIINISSVVAFTGNPGQSNYCAAKAGVVGMTRSLSQEVASRGITVNCIAPGFIESPMTAGLNEVQKAAIATRIPSGVMGEPMDIGFAAVYLASNEARYITGHTLHVNGGMFSN